MKKSKILAGVLAISLIFVVFSGAVLAAGDKTDHKGKSHYGKIAEKWSALNDKQRSEVYAIYDEQVKLRIKMVDKYAELGLIDSETAKTMKGKITARSEEVKGQ